MSRNRKRRRRPGSRDAAESEANASIPFPDHPAEPAGETEKAEEAEESPSAADAPADPPGEAPGTESAGEAPGGAVDEDLDDAEARLREAEREMEELRANWMRARADLENYRKRQERERAQWKQGALADLLNDFLPALDDLDRTLAEGEKEGAAGPFLEGVRLVRDNFRNVLERHGVRPIEALGKRFDPTVHEAMAAVPNGEVEPNTVTEVFQSGYTLDEAVLRPARVIVSAPPPEA